MFERFTNQSRRVVVLAQEEARMLDHNYIGTEHLLLGLLHEGRGSAARALTAMDVTLSAARDQVVALVGRGQEQPSGHIPFTPRAKKSLELSLRESLQLGDGYIGTGHLMLGVIRQGDNVAIKVLDKLGADLSNLRARVTQELRNNPEDNEVPAAEREQRRVRVILHDTVQSLLDTIDDRLSAIERHLGLTQPVSAALRSLDGRIAQVQRDKEAAVDAQDFGRAAELRDAEKQLIEERQRVELEEAAAAEAAVVRAETAPATETADDTETAPAARRRTTSRRHPRLRRTTPAAGTGGAAESTEAAPAAGTGGAVGEPEELARLQARVARLEERLREHGLDPAEPQEPPAAAG